MTLREWKAEMILRDGSMLATAKARGIGQPHFSLITNQKRKPTASERRKLEIHLGPELVERYFGPAPKPKKSNGYCIGRVGSIDAQKPQSF